MAFMSIADPRFSARDGLDVALELLGSRSRDPIELPLALPESGLGDMRALEMLSGHVLGKAARLGSPTSLVVRSTKDFM
jgi:L-2,4-diaminobutyrate decarboxylase